MEGVGTGKATFAGNDAGEFIISRDLPFPDGLVAAAKVIEFLCSTDSKIHKIKKEIYQPRIAKGTVMVPWNERGRIMRRLATDFVDKRVESLEGIKIMVESGWVLINPSTDEPVFEIIAESSNIQSATTILKDFESKVSDIISGIENGP